MLLYYQITKAKRSRNDKLNNKQQSSFRSNTEQADKAFKIADLIVFVIVTVIYLTKTPVDWAQVDEWLVLLTALLGYVVSVFSGEFTHDTIKGTPLIGYSYSEKKLNK